MENEPWQKPDGSTQAQQRGILTPPSAAPELPGAERSGTFPIGLGRRRDGLVQVPASPPEGRARPLLIILHGAGASASDVVPMVAPAAERLGVLVLAPESRGATWDMIQHDYGPDVAFLDAALDQLFRSHAVDRNRMAIGGFSDGASYALSLGLTNGALFSDILAFSPGFAAPRLTEGAPRIFVSHGRQDPVLPIERCGRRLARMLREAGYDTEYREFTGGHVVPTDLVEAAFRRFLG